MVNFQSIGKNIIKNLIGSVEIIIMVKSTTNKVIFYKKICKCSVEMTPPLKICKSKPQSPPRMLTYATTKASF